MLPAFIRKNAVLLVIFLTTAAVLDAQIFSQGSDPGRLRWFQVRTPHYQVIYPSGTDSLARIYAARLEQFREATGRSLGMAPGEFQRRRLPVVLHTEYGYSNGSMFWAPRRMDLFTRMDPYGADPSPWSTQLTTHEPRHLAQLQAGYRLWKPLNWVFGELWPAAVWALYPNQPLSEGDAVALETALTAGARTRTADFLNYFRVAFDAGDWRNWYRWRYGSYKRYTPDYYKAGYMTVAGMRYFYDEPLFMKEFFDGVVARPLLPGHRQRSVRAVSGKPFQDTFQDIMQGFHALWQEEDAAREPFMPMEQLTRTDGFARDYSGCTILDGKLFALREGLAEARALVIFEQGRERVLRPFSYGTSSLFADPARHRLYWSETIADPRWTLAHTSRIRYLAPDGTVHDLTAAGRLYNPHPLPDGSAVVCVDYPSEGGSAVVVVSADDGTVLHRWSAPDGIQACEGVEWDGSFYVSGLGEKGYGLYRIARGGEWETVLEPAVTKLVNLGSGGEGLEFVADRDGRNELYRFSPSTGELVRLTASRYGGTDYCEHDGWLYFCSQTLDGMMLFRTALSDLRPGSVRYGEVHTCPVEEAITAQEQALAGGGPLFPEIDKRVVSAPAPYRKWAHLIHLHSWAPVWFNYDAIASQSLDFSYRTASPGVTGLLQNDLGTAYGSVGYSAHKDPAEESRWRHSLHAQFTYTGLYPVFEASVDFNDQAARQYTFYDLRSSSGETLTTGGAQLEHPSLEGSLTAYIPLNFSSGGRLRGLIPRVGWSASNSWFNTTRVTLDRMPDFEGWERLLQLGPVTAGRNVPMQRLSASVRGYLMRSRAESQVYPRLGLGAEIGAAVRPGLERVFTPTVYGYLYGYLPGFTPTQGLRWTAIGQHQLSAGTSIGENQVTVWPRGFSAAAGRAAAQLYGTQAKVTADYAVPVWVGDLSWFSPVAYVKNLLFIPHADAAFFGGKAPFRQGSQGTASLCSIGVDATVELANLAWFPFGCSVGVSANFLGGSFYKTLQEAGLVDRPYSFSLIFSMDM